MSDFDERAVEVQYVTEAVIAIEQYSMYVTKDSIKLISSDFSYRGVKDV